MSRFFEAVFKQIWNYLSHNGIICFPLSHDNAAVLSELNAGFVSALPWPYSCEPLIYDLE